MSLFRKKMDEKNAAPQDDGMEVPQRPPEPEPRATEQRAQPRPRPQAQPRSPGTRRMPVDDLTYPIKVRNRTPEDDAQVPRRARSTSDERPRPAPAPVVVPVTGEPVERSETTGTEAQDDDWRGGTWADSGYRATDEEAHRDRVYDPPGFLVQMLIVMFAQMKMFTKKKALVVMIVAIALIPILSFLMVDVVNMFASGYGATMSNAFIALLLIFLPTMIAFFTSLQCGRQVPDEFKERTAYMSIPLPMHRLAFYFGKYLAGFLYCLAVFLLAYGVAILCTAMRFDEFFVDVLLVSIIGTIVAVLVYSSMAFCIGCFLRKGSALLPLALNLVVLPMMFIIVSMRTHTDFLMSMPIFLPDMVIQSMGLSTSASVTGFLTLIGASQSFGSMGAMCVYGLLWSAAFLALGAFRMTRREM